MKLFFAITAIIITTQNSFSAWRCEGTCSVTKKESNMVYCTSVNRESCERSGKTWNETYSTNCYCEMYHYSNFPVYSYENTRWLAENEIYKSCGSKTNGPNSVWYSEKNVTCNGN